jgi:hypothetical protein
MARTNIPMHLLSGDQSVLEMALLTLLPFLQHPLLQEAH